MIHIIIGNCGKPHDMHDSGGGGGGCLSPEMIGTILGNGNPDMKRIVCMDKSILSVMLSNLA